ncbi:hypothetical protein PHYPSEUDO_001432 [Phytophthora pseudosyringae]|uniref:Uncharacterized protein n=1 Tax=Phytophthora pseudosyringae TaxID=221518 RepID=A0A8T1VVH7_9STRA|nr:hypothetical protein PHYPSEUDO_001432 [Phytophthora pseudosyringae]
MFLGHEQLRSTSTYGSTYWHPKQASPYRTCFAIGLLPLAPLLAACQQRWLMSSLAVHFRRRVLDNLRGGLVIWCCFQHIQAVSLSVRQPALLDVMRAPWPRLDTAVAPGVIPSGVVIFLLLTQPLNLSCSRDFGSRFGRLLLSTSSLV